MDDDTWHLFLASSYAFTYTTHTYAGTCMCAHTHMHVCSPHTKYEARYCHKSLLSSFHTYTITCGPHLLLETVFLSVALYFFPLFKGRNFEQQVKLVTWQERTPTTLLKTQIQSNSFLPTSHIQPNKAIMKSTDLLSFWRKFEKFYYVSVYF